VFGSVQCFQAVFVPSGRFPYQFARCDGGCERHLPGVPRGTFLDGFSFQVGTVPGKNPGPLSVHWDSHFLFVWESKHGMIFVKSDFVSLVK
jgi:hypothetical protein